MKKLVGTAVLAGFALVAITVAAAAPTPFQLRFEGVHMPPTTVEGDQAQVQHEGPFTASAPLCASGYAVDLRFEQPKVAVRRHTCSDGSGSFTARIAPVSDEHGGRGGWRIVEGSGRYEKLRGKGTFTGIRVRVDPADLLSPDYRTTWAGVVDFDDLAPELERATATVRRLARPHGAYALRVAFSARDAAGGPVAYRLEVTPARSSSLIATRHGATTGGTVSTSLRIRPLRHRRIKLQIVASDAVGNERVLTRAIRIPS